MVEKLWKADAIWFGVFDSGLWRELVVSLSTVWHGGRGWVSFARKFAIHTLHTICNLSCSWHWSWFRPVDFSIEPYKWCDLYNIYIWLIGNSFGVPMPGPSYADICGSDDCPGVPVVKVVTISVSVFAVLLLCQLCWFCCRRVQRELARQEEEEDLGWGQISCWKRIVCWIKLSCNG